MNPTSDSWGADVPISRPAAAPSDVKVDFLGFGFTMGGIAFNVSEAEIEDIYTPPFAPDTREDG